MKPICALVVEEQQSCESVRTLLGVQPHWRVIGRCQGMHDLPGALTQSTPEVIFLNSRFLDEDGSALARTLHQLHPRPLVIFMPACGRQADCQLNAFDDPRLQTVLRWVEQALAAPAPQHSPPCNINVSPPVRYARNLVIRSTGRVQFVNVAHIDWLKGAGNYVEIHAGKESFLHRERMHVLQARLDPADFLRIHRSLIVNLAAVKELRPIAAGDYNVILRDGKCLRLSRTHRSALEALTVS